MHKRVNISLIFSVFFILYFNAFPSTVSGNEKLKISYGVNTISARLDNVPLKLILENLSKEKRIWFNRAEPQLDKKISIQFSDLNLENGLRRILSDTNHALFFDEKKRVIGLFILDKDNRGMSQAMHQNSFISPFTQQIIENPFQKPISPSSNNPFSIESNDLSVVGNELSSEDPLKEGSYPSAQNPFEMNPFKVENAPTDNNESHQTDPLKVPSNPKRE